MVERSVRTTELATQIARRRAAIDERIAAASLAAGRSAEHVTLMAVTKNQPAEVVSAAVAAGLRLFGENRVQEMVEKFGLSGALVDPGSVGVGEQPISVHCIGHLQRNKAKQCVAVADMLQSLDSVDTLQAVAKALASDIQAQPDRLAGTAFEVLIEVNTSGEPQKYGVTSESALFALVDAVTAAGSAATGRRPIVLRGLMTVAPFVNDERAIRRCFATLRSMYEKVATQVRDARFSMLSMGMSGDFEAAIAEGSTIVRIGTALFGDRS